MLLGEKKIFQIWQKWTWLKRLKEFSRKTILSSKAGWRTIQTG
jgi:hypothetical protein